MGVIKWVGFVLLSADEQLHKTTPVFEKRNRGKIEI